MGEEHILVTLVRPSFASFERGHQQYPSWPDVVRDLTPSDFTRFRVYAPLVIRVGRFSEPRTGLVLGKSVWDALWRCSPGPLPNRLLQLF